MGVINEIFKDVIGLFFNPKYEESKGAVLEKFTPKFDQLKALVGNNNHALGYLTLADFVIAETYYLWEALWVNNFNQNINF